MGAPIFEASQVGKRQSLANLIANIEADATPYTSMLDKREKPKQSVHQWQVESYPVTGHVGVIDGKDATEFNGQPRALVQCYEQKTWYNPKVSDFAEEAEVAGVSKGEMAKQVVSAMVTVKRQIEKRCLGNDDTLADDGVTHGFETRGIGKWLDNTAQTLFPVPDGYRTPAASNYAGTLANFTEAVFLAQTQSSYTQRKGPFKMDAFLGILLKSKFTEFSKYSDDVASKTAVRDFRQDAKDKTLISVIDKLVLDTGVVDLHPVSFLYTDRVTGIDSAYTTRSGVVMDMDKAGLAYTRMPRVIPLPYLGGGYKKIVDAIFLHMVDNPLGGMKIECSS